jgi:RNA recognition motif-containing protein
MPFSADEGELEDAFSQFGNVQNIRFGRRPDGTSKGFAHVEFTNVAAATKVFQAAQNEPVMLGNRSLRVDYAAERTPTLETQPYHKLYVYDWRADEEALSSAFKQFSRSITSVHILRDMDGKSLKSGFVEFTSVEQATEALNVLNGHEPEYGNKLNLSYARPRRTQQRSGRGFSGGGRGNSGY